MALRDMEGQARVISWLQTAVKQHRLAHAYLFTSEQATQGKQLAVELAKWLNCERHGADSCDACPTCLQIAHDNHPDVIRLQPDGAYIKMEQVRAVQASFRYRATVGITRVLIIEAADQMRMETANSLLKFLEEPVTPMVAMLLTDKKERILPTIRSRCQWVRLGVANEASSGIGDRYQEQWAELKSDEQKQLIDKLITWTESLLHGEDMALLAVQVGWIAQEVEQRRGQRLLTVLLQWLTSLLRPDDQQFTTYQPQRAKLLHDVSEQTVLLACDNALIASRLAQRTEISANAIWEQFVLATQAGQLSRQNDWQMIIG